MKPKKRKLLDLLMLFLLLSGIGILAYPFVSDALNNYLDQQIISHYQQQAVKENEEVMAKIQENMTKKNQQLKVEIQVQIPLLRKKNLRKRIEPILRNIRSVF